MKLMIIAALLTAATILYLLKPIMTPESPHRTKGLMILVIFPLAALGLYLWLGSPDLPSGHK